MSSANKPATTRWRQPALLVAARVLKQYRGRSSILFILRWTVWHRLIDGDPPALPETILSMLGVHNPRIDKIAGIYNGLEHELGTLTAARACVEIIQAIESQH